MGHPSTCVTLCLCNQEPSANHNRDVCFFKFRGASPATPVLCVSSLWCAWARDGAIEQHTARSAGAVYAADTLCMTLAVSDAGRFPDISGTPNVSKLVCYQKCVQDSSECDYLYKFVAPSAPLRYGQ